MIGLVSGRHAMDVIPDALAALLISSIVSICSYPGSPAKTHISISPGDKAFFLQSIILQSEIS